MTQFVAFDAKTEVLGAVISVYSLALGPEAQPLLKQHSLDFLDPDQWYPQQTLLNVLRDAAEGDLKAMFDLVRTGMKVPEMSLKRLDLSEFEKLIMSMYGECNPFTLLQAAFTSDLPMGYSNVHRNGYPGKYELTRTGQHAANVRIETPYPCDFDYGVIWGDIRTFFASKLTFTVRHAEGPCRQKGSDACVYQIEWSPTANEWHLT
jgi:hypothetical protein